MSRFDYIRPTTIDEAITLLADPAHDSRVLAGGTDLLVHIRQHPPDFDRVIDISLLPELRGITRAGDIIRLGSGVTYADLLESPLLQEIAPFFGEVAIQVGGPQIRNTGTVGGNVVNAAPGADMLPVLACLDATVHLRGANGSRQLPLSDFLIKPNHTRLEPGELLTHFTFPVPPPGARTVFLKLGRRRSQAISRLTVAAIGHTDADGVVDFVRYAPGAATPRVIRFRDVEDILLGQRPSPELFAAAGRQAADAMIAITGRRWSTEYKEPALAALTERVLQRVFPAADEH